MVIPTDLSTLSLLSSPTTCHATPHCCTPHEGALAARFSLMLGVLSASRCMFGDPRQYPTDYNACNKYDYIIVGGGTAGCVLANRLSQDMNKRVLVLEQGGDPSDSSEIPNFIHSVSMSCEAKIYQTEANFKSCRGCKGNRCLLQRGSVLGGTSVIGRNLWLHGNPEDYNNMASLSGNQRWNYKNMLEFIKLAEDYKVSNFYHGKGGPLNISPYQNKSTNEIYRRLEKSFNCMGLQTKDLNAGNQIGFMYADVIQLNNMKGNTAKTYLKQAKGRENLYISKHSAVKKLLFDKSCRKVIGVEYVKNGVTNHVYAEHEVIIAAGGLGTPQLLMLSGIGPQEHLKQLGIHVIKDHPQVGKNLQVHPKTICLCYSITYDKLNNPNELIDSMYEYLTRKKGILSDYTGENLVAFVNATSPSTSNYPTIQITPYFATANSTILSSMLDTYGLTDEIKQIYINLNYNNALLFFGITLLNPKCIGSIQLSTSSLLDPPIVNTNMLCENQDIDKLLDGIKFCMKLSIFKDMKKLGAKLVGQIPNCSDVKNRDDYWRCAIQHITTAMHPTGTCAIGKVVDSDLKLIGLNGVRITGGACMPRVFAAPNIVPTIAIAEKLAYIINKI